MVLSLLQLLQQHATNFPWIQSLQIFSVVPLLLLILLVKWVFAAPTPRPPKNLPPSPPKLPILGNFHQLSNLPHQALHSLAQRYGPLMLMQFGIVPTVIVSSPDVAREVMKTQDLAFADRPRSQKLRLTLYDMKDVAVAPYGEHWRQLKSIFVLHLLSKARVRSFQSLREEETELLMSKIRESSSTPVDLSDLIVTFNNNVVCRAAFGRRYGGAEDGAKLKNLFKEFTELLGMFCFRDFVPWWLGWLDRVLGTDARIARVTKGIDEFLEELIGEREDRLAKQSSGSTANYLDEHTQADFVDMLLKIQKDGSIGISLDRDSIKALLLDVYAGGTDTTSSVLEWAMAELLRNPEIMKKLQSEVKGILKGKQGISADDLEQMVFMKAVIKETMRRHPPVALQGRQSREDVKLLGYDIAAGTMILINNWSIARDPNYWETPLEFRPERFLDSSFDFKGLDNFQYLPFGAGRRQCPGITFAMASLEYVLANLVAKFDWALPMGVEAADLDMSEFPTAVLARKTPLLALATPR